ncbi:hypothetical protein [Streptomyces sp. NRRL S-455]|uniref:hypothetical protein n=1 Tax=Streptomyces sp. NRRL S-455 TaxID=1463908 RepID=UPI0004C087C0|nr:hypothetical protein [Streptomyces sp. NRRL S-455]
MTSLYQAVKPIPTTVHGVTTRSRLEARWIVFFERAGIPWEYEPQAYRVGDGRGYLPDFRIRPHRGADQAWMEIKPLADTFDDPRWKGLVTVTGLMLFTVRGLHRRGDVCGRDHTVRVWHPSGMVADVHRMWTGPEFRTAWDAASAARFDRRRPAGRKGRRE